MVVILVSNRKVGDAVAIEVGCNDRRGVRTRHRVTGRGKSISAAVEKNRYSSIGAGHRDIIEAIAIEVDHRNTGRRAAIMYQVRIAQHALAGMYHRDTAGASHDQVHPARYQHIRCHRIAGRGRETQAIRRTCRYREPQRLNSGFTRAPFHSAEDMGPGRESSDRESRPSGAVYSHDAESLNPINELHPQAAWRVMNSKLLCSLERS